MRRRLRRAALLVPALLIALALLGACDDGAASDDGEPSATPEATETASPTATRTATATPTETPTATPTPQPTPAAVVRPDAPQPLVTAMWSGEAQGNGAPWFAVQITPGADLLADPWTLVVGDISPASFTCQPREQDGNTLLEGCTGLRQGVTFSGRLRPGDPPELDVRFSRETLNGTQRLDATLTPAWVRDEPQASPNTTLAWHHEDDLLGSYTDVWAEDGVVFAPHTAGTIEVLDAASGERLSLIDVRDYPPSAGLQTWVGDVKARGNLLYAATTTKGVLIFNVADPTEPVYVGQYVLGGGGTDTFTNVHNVTLSPDGQTLYAINQSHARTDLRILDVSEPANPREVGRFFVPGAFSTLAGVHDVHVIDYQGRRIAFLNALASGLLILDVTDPAAIEQLGGVQPEGTFSHSGWAFEHDGGLYYIHTDEGYNQGITIFDVSDLSDPRAIATYQTRPGVSVHNVEVIGDTAYVSYYIDGLRLLDLADPSHPLEAGHFDTVPPEEERDITQGAWGVHVDGGRVYISDRANGIFAIEVDGLEGP